MGCFRFSEDDVFKRIGVLSGGERNRYALARMLLRPANFLLLDEPTNHLDMRAKDVLLEALQNYTGTVVFVSHDRYFIDKLATKVFEVAAGGVQVYPGNYEDYLWRKQAETAALPGTPAPPQEDEQRTALASEPPPERKKKRINPMLLKQMQDRVAELEEQVSRTEAEIAGLETALSQFRSAEETMRLSAQLQARRAELEDLLARWEEASAAIEAAI